MEHVLTLVTAVDAVGLGALGLGYGAVDTGAPSRAKTAGHTSLLSAVQIRTGRYLLGWGPSRLARKTGVPFSVIAHAEGSLPPQGLDQATSDRIRRVMEAAGVEFSGDTGVQIKAESTTRIRPLRTEPRSRHATRRGVRPCDPQPGSADLQPQPRDE